MEYIFDIHNTCVQVIVIVTGKMTESLPILKEVELPLDLSDGIKHLHLASIC